MDLDTESKLASPFRAIRGKVIKYQSALKKYTIRADVGNLGIIECPGIDLGIDSPHEVGEDVLLLRIPNQGWLVMGRIPVTRNVPARTSSELPTSAPTELNEVSYQDPDSDEHLFHALPGDSITIRNKTKFVVSAVGVIAAKVKDSCSMLMSGALSVIKFTMFDLLLSLPRLTVRMFQDRNDEQPKLQAQFKPKNANNLMRFLMGGASADDSDGIDLALGSTTRMLMQLLPANHSLTYTQNGDASLRVESNIGQFLLKFGTGSFRWTDAGLVVTKDNTTILVDASSLVISTQTATLTAETLTAKVNGAATLTANDVQIVSQIVIMQNFHWLTVVQRLNS